MAEFIPMQDVREYLTRKEASALFKQFTSPRDRMLFKTLYYTGRRTSEVVRSLKPKHIDTKNSMIAWKILKKNPRRRDPITGMLPLEKKKPPLRYKPAPEKLVRGLIHFINTRGINKDEYVFRISARRVRQIFKDKGEDAGFSRHIHPHMLRHTFAIEGAKNAETPADIVLLKDMLDHSKIDTTMFYLQFNPKRQRELLDKMWKE